MEKKLLSKRGWLSYLVIALLVILVFSISASNVQAQEVKYCCEKTIYGAWCQEADQEECDEEYRSNPTSCEATSFCRLGCCYDSFEGICMENTPQKVCDENEGTWNQQADCEIPQCSLGCCILGTQASFVTLTRCKKLSAFYGLVINFRRDIVNELECISLASISDEGACIYELDYKKTCKFTSRQECKGIKQNVPIGNITTGGVVTSGVEFFKDMLCSAEELGTDCGITKNTVCIEEKDEVYFVDSCGNIANIYDASKVNDKAYWRKKVSKEDSCNPDSPNINSAGCGNCNYFSGSICGKYETGNRPTYGKYICRDLNCKASDTTDNKPHKHGESWCSTGKYQDSVGSRYYRHLCLNGEEIIEPCADFRQERCIEDDIAGFSQAACRVNRWQDCYSQTEKRDCGNKDKRDCIWTSEKKEVEKEEVEEGSLIVSKAVEIACIPEHAPGLKFWEEGEAQGICGLANTQCEVSYEEAGFIFPRKEACIENCECLEDSWKQEQLAKCESLGDCGAKLNFIGRKGEEGGKKIRVKEGEVEEEEGGLFGLHLILNKLGTGEVVEDDEK